VPVGMMFTVETGELAGTTIVVSLDMGGKVGMSGEGIGTEGA